VYDQYAEPAGRRVSAFVYSRDIGVSLESDDAV
jgi:hypothetical protein